MKIIALISRLLLFSRAFKRKLCRYGGGRAQTLNPFFLKNSETRNMKAIRIHDYGGPEVLRYKEVPSPAPGTGELLIKVHAASVNPLDWKTRAGYLKDFMPHPLPFIPGWDASGVVEAVGSGVTNFSKGDEVYARTYRDGTYAEYAIVMETETALKPRSVDHVHVAAVPLAALTAWQALFDKAQLGAGQKVLIHGTYSLLAVMYPEADIPVVQVSIQSGYDPESHLQLGRALAPLRDEGILLIGSGSSYHNFHPQDPREESAQFDAWLQETLVNLQETLVNSVLKERSERLLNWERAPFARAAQPEEDHLVPLHVAVGAAEEEPGQVIYRQEHFFGRITASSYRFGQSSIGPPQSRSRGCVAATETSLSRRRRPITAKPQQSGLREPEGRHGL